MTSEMSPYTYQSVGIRFAALLIDVIILAIISALITLPFSISLATITNASSITPSVFSPLASLVAIIIEILYFTLLLGTYGQTVGKKAVHIKVVKEDGTKIGYVDALVRTVLLVIDAIPYFIPYLLGAILIWTSDKKQRLGDRVARTIVVSA